jgi:hypothetical protein
MLQCPAASSGAVADTLPPLKHNSAIRDFYDEDELRRV